MLCPKCGADYPSDQLRCPYCNAVNEEALKLAKELQQYDKKYEESREEMLNTGESAVLKKITIGIGIAFGVILLITVIITSVVNYRYTRNSPINVTGKRYEKNKAKLEEYMNNKDYIRAYLLASSTDPTTEYFKNYPEYADELSAIYTYELVFHEIKNVTEEMDKGNNYRALTENNVISLVIFYTSPESEVKDELVAEVDQYLRELYRLTDDEIELLKSVKHSSEFTIEGSDNYEEITKERMVEYYGK